MVLSKYAYKKLWLCEGLEFVEFFWSSDSESQKHKQRLIEHEREAAAACANYLLLMWSHLHILVLAALGQPE